MKSIDTAKIKVTDGMAAAGLKVLQESSMIPYGETWGALEDIVIAEIFTAMFLVAERENVFPKKH